MALQGHSPFSSFCGGAADVSNEDFKRLPFAFVTTDREMNHDRFLELLGRNFAELDEELRARAPTAVVSTTLKIQLGWLRSGQACSYGGKICRFDERAVVDEITHLENGTTRTKTNPAEPLSGMLNGFWHKHFFEARFLPRNLREETEENFDIFWYRDLLRAREQSELAGEENIGRLTGLIAQTLVHGAFMHRAGSLSKGARPRLTGEWIVFAKENNRNVYLTLGTHDERNESIAIRIWQCGCEFPFVLQILKSNGVEIALCDPNEMTPRNGRSW
jgi:hypothetical protein